MHNEDDNNFNPYGAMLIIICIISALMITWLLSVAYEYITH